jgi:hypothetical protein
VAAYFITPDWSRNMNAALGFRVKSGWAAAVLVAGSPDSPEVRDRQAIDLCDATVPGSRQPYHAAMGRLQTDNAKVERLKKVIVRAAERSVKELLTNYSNCEFDIRVAGLVVGSQIDPATIANPHIRAHALEGQLFRTVLEDSLKSCGVGCMVIRERDLYKTAAKALERTEGALKTYLAKLGRSLSGPWRADDKAACLAGWLALADSTGK